MKFGGTSVEDASAFERVASLVGRVSQARPVVVVSAMSRFTDALIEAFERAARGEHDGASLSLEEHFARHAEVARALLASDAAAEIASAAEAARRELKDPLREASRHEASQQDEPQQARPLAVLQDSVVSHGERLSSQLLAAVLGARGLAARHVDARRCLITDDEHGRATPLKEETERHTREEIEPLIESGIIPELGGFIASSASTGETTTLGRGGSDFTAGVVGARPRPRETQIWSGVPRVVTPEPRTLNDVR